MCINKGKIGQGEGGGGGGEDDEEETNDEQTLVAIIPRVLQDLTVE
jgi:hypothetical protein